MAVFKIAEWDFNRPYWCKFSGCGLYKMPKGMSEEHTHRHDCDEYLIITEGRASLLLNGRVHDVVSGNCVCIPAGVEHRILRALEDLVLVWIHDKLKSRGPPSVERQVKPPQAKIVKMGRWREDKPSWSRLTDMGIIKFPKGRVEMDYHYHDCHEYYFVTEGSLLVLVEGKHQRIEEGEVCPIRIGYRHKVVEALQDSTLVWIQDELMRKKRYGHLHYEEEGYLPILALKYKPTPPKTREYGIGIIGVGRIANKRQIPSYLKAGLKIVAICDINEERLNAAKKRWGIEKAFVDYHDLLELEEVEIVDILTQSWVRPPIVKDAAKARKHIICEKPFARSMEEAYSLVQAAEDAGVKIAVHQPTRWYYPFALAKALVQRGYIGEPFLYIDDRCHYLDTVYYEHPITRWHIHLEDFLPIEWGVHSFDIARWLFEEEPVRVYGSGIRMPFQNFKSEMAAGFVADFPSLRAIFTMHMANQSDEYYWYFRIEGTDGVIKGSVEPPWLACYSRKLGNRWERVEWSYREAIEEAHGGPMFELINAIFEDREPSNSGRDNLNTVRFSLAAFRSLIEKRPVDLKEIT